MQSDEVVEVDKVDAEIDSVLNSGLGREVQMENIFTKWLTFEKT